MASERRSGIIAKFSGTPWARNRSSSRMRVSSSSSMSSSRKKIRLPFPQPESAQIFLNSICQGVR